MDNSSASKRAAGLGDYLAAERTALAWIRTGLALMGFGFVVARFGLFLQEFQTVQHTRLGQSYGPSLWFGTALIVVGVMVNVFAGLSHARLIRTLDRGEEPQSHTFLRPAIVAFLLALVGLAMAIYLIVVRSSTRAASSGDAGASSTACVIGSGIKLRG